MQPARTHAAHVIGCLLLWATAAAYAGAQLGSYPSVPGTPSGSNSSNSRSNSTVNNPGLRTLGNDFPSFDPNMSHRQQVARREELHRRMLDNAAKLLLLSRELQEDLHLHEAADAEAHRLDDIAKLARTVRDQMKQ